MTAPRVSIFNCVSTALGMLEFSTKAILGNAGTEDFDYIIVHWLASPEVMEYLEALKRVLPDRVHLVRHETNNAVGYVPNLRAMMNAGFERGFQINEYCGLVNTDQYFGRDWLRYLVKYASPHTIVNSVHITPIRGPHVVTDNMGVPEEGIFHLERFNALYDKLFEDRLETESERGGWLATNTMPYLIPRRLWEIAGPWELELKSDRFPRFPPDRRFFQRCKDAGALFTMSRGSIVYHHEAVERRRQRPRGAEHLKDET